jgi:predicted 5'-methylthioadenosine/S-adenosylhomocysteine nucleosidase
MLLVVAATERELALAHGVETLLCGVGPVEAAIRTTRALAEGTATAVLHIGIAGARTIDAPALVLGSEAVYSDVIDAGSTFPRVERAAANAALLAAARRALPEAHVVPISTTGRIGGGDDVEAMEGFAVLRACALAHVPALEVRVIVNEISEPDRTRWRFEEGFTLLAETLPLLLEALRA